MSAGSVCASSRTGLTAVCVCVCVYLHPYPQVCACVCLHVFVSVAAEPGLPAACLLAALCMHACAVSISDHFVFKGMGFYISDEARSAVHELDEVGK